MPVPSRYISLQAIVNVVDSHSPDANQPYAICSRCNFVLEKDGPITLPVYHWSEDGPLTPGSTVFCVGNLFFPPGDDEGHVAASMMWVMSMPQLETEVQPDDEDSPEEPKISYPPSSVFPIGVLKNAIGRSWFLEVGFYDRISKSQKVFNIEVSVPDTKRYENVKPPAVDRLVSIQGTLASVSTYEEIANIKLESVVYITMTNGPTAPYSSPKAGKSKRQICDERGSPMKKVKVGPAPGAPVAGAPVAGAPVAGAPVAGGSKGSDSVL